MGNHPSRATITTSETLLKSSSPDDTRRGSEMLSEICRGIIAGEPPPHKTGRGLHRGRKSGRRRRKRRGKNGSKFRGLGRREQREWEQGMERSLLVVGGGKESLRSSGGGLGKLMLTESERGEMEHVFGPLLGERLGKLSKYLCRVVRGDCNGIRDVDSVLAASDALDAIGRLFRYAQEREVRLEVLGELAAPLRKRGLAALLARFWDRDLRVVGGARVALESLGRISAVQTSPWISVVNASIAFRISSAEAALKNLLVNLSTLVHFIFYDAVANAEQRAERWNRKHRASGVVPVDHVSRMDSMNSPTDEVTTGRASLDMPDAKTRRISYDFEDDVDGTAALGRRSSTYSTHAQSGQPYLVRDMEAAMHIYAALLGHGTTNNPRLRKLVVDDIHMVFSSALDGSRAFSAGLDQKTYRDIAITVFENHGKLLYHAVLKVMFTESESGAYVAQKNCSRQTARVCTQFLSLLLREAPQVCVPRSGLFTGSCSKAVSSLVESNTQISPRRRLDLLKAAFRGVKLLAMAIPSDQYDALNLVAMDPTKFESTIESCLRSLAYVATQFAKMEALLYRETSFNALCETLKTWLALTTIGQRGLLWAKGPTYCSGIAFLSQVARRIARTPEKKRHCNEVVLGTEVSGTSSAQESNLVSGSGTQSLSQRRRLDSYDGRRTRLTEYFESCTDVMIREAGSVNVAKDLYRTIVFEYARILRPAAFKNEALSSYLGSPRPSAAGEVDSQYLTDSISFNTETGLLATSEDADRIFQDSFRRTSVSSLQYTRVPEGDSLTWLLESCMTNDGLKIAAYRELSVDALPSTVGFWFSTSLPPGARGSKDHASEDIISPGITSSSPSPVGTALLSTSRPKPVDQDLFFEFGASLALVIKMTKDEKESEEDRKGGLEWIANDVNDAKSPFVTAVYEESLMIAGLRAREDRQDRHPYGIHDSHRTSNLVLKETSAMLCEMKMLRSEVAELRSSLVRMEQRGGRNLVRRFSSQGPIRRKLSHHTATRSSSMGLSYDENNELGPVRDSRSRSRGLRRLFQRDCC